VWVVKDQSQSASSGVNAGDAVLGAQGSKLQLVNTIFHLRNRPEHPPGDYEGIAPTPR
jgi:hypothetical protein